MSDNSAGEPPPPLENSKLENEIWWVVRRVEILLQSWTTPVNAPTVNTFTRDDGVSARAFALILIVALAFAVRGDRQATAGATFTALAGGLAVIMSFLLNMFGRTFRVTLSERMILSAYMSTILVMIFFFLLEISSRGNWLAVFAQETVGEVLGKELGPAVAMTVLAVILVFLLLLMKAWLWDKQTVKGKALKHAVALTVGSGVIVLTVSLLSSQVFQTAIECLKEPGWACSTK